MTVIDDLTFFGLHSSLNRFTSTLKKHLFTHIFTHSVHNIIAQPQKITIRTDTPTLFSNLPYLYYDIRQFHISSQFFTCTSVSSIFL